MQFEEITLNADICVRLKDALEAKQLALVVPSKGIILFLKSGKEQIVEYKDHSYLTTPFFIRKEMLERQTTHLRILNEGEGDYALITYIDSKYKSTPSCEYIFGAKYFTFKQWWIRSKIVFVPHSKVCSAEMAHILALAENYDATMTR